MFRQIEVSHSSSTETKSVVSTFAHDALNGADAIFAKLRNEYSQVARLGDDSLSKLGFPPSADVSIADVGRESKLGSAVGAGAGVVASADRNRQREKVTEAEHSPTKNAEHLYVPEIAVGVGLAPTGPSGPYYFYYVPITALEHNRDSAKQMQHR